MAEDRHLSIGRNVKIGFFHLGSGMADVMTTGIWNRIMISDLGFAATPVGLLVSLRYFLAPLGIWAGGVSDRRAVAGYRRLFWIWLGRAMMVLSVFALGWQTTTLARGAEANFLAWMILASALLLFSLGSAISGSTFLALIYDRAPQRQRGRAVGIVWTFLLLGFTVGGVLFGIMLPGDKAELHRLFKLPDYIPDSMGFGLAFAPDTLQNLFLAAGLLLGGLWFFSLVGEEQRWTNAPEAAAAPVRQKTSLIQDLRVVRDNRPMRFFFWYLALSMLFAFSQDLILEPFAADVFNMPPHVTTRFAAYWGTFSIVGTLGFLWLSRRFRGLTNTVMSRIGVALLTLTLAMFAVSALIEVRTLITPGLVLLGLGLGVWNIGTLGLMMDMSPAGRAGTFLGLWTLTVTFARGLGVSGGGILRDFMLSLSGDLPLSYGVVFALGAFGLAVSWWALNQIGMEDPLADAKTEDASTVLAAALD